MPEQQANPTEPSSQQGYSTPPPLESSKRTYLSLLPPPQLIDLILAIDANRQTIIFPHDLDSAIKALQRPRQSQSPSPGAAATTVEVRRSDSTPTPPQAPPPKQNHTPQVQAQSPVVQPPQYKPPVYKQPAHPQHIYPYAHTPYYPQPLPLQPQVHVSPPPHASPAPSTRHPLFTSMPLARDPSRPPHPPLPAPPSLVSSRDDPNAMPSYEEMIVEAIMDVGDADGTAPKTLFSWMASHYPLQQNFRPSASQALHKALKRGRLEKIGGKYRLNPSWGGGPTTSKRATRRPTANRAVTPPLPRPPHTSGLPPNAIPPPGYTHPHPPYGYAPYPHHPPLQLHPYGPAYDPNGGVWIAGQPHPLPQPLNGDGLSGKVDGMDVEEGNDSDDAENLEVGARVVDVDDESEIKRSLLRLAEVLRRFASREEGTDTDMQE